MEKYNLPLFAQEAAEDVEMQELSLAADPIETIRDLKRNTHKLKHIYISNSSRFNAFLKGQIQLQEKAQRIIYIKQIKTERTDSAVSSTKRN